MKFSLPSSVRNAHARRQRNPGQGRVTHSKIASGGIVELDAVLLIEDGNSHRHALEQQIQEVDWLVCLGLVSLDIEMPRVPSNNDITIHNWAHYLYQPIHHVK